MIVIIDYGMGNIGSLDNMIRKAGGEALVSSDPGTVRRAAKLVLPGVGSFDNGMSRLNETGLSDAIRERVIRDRTPILGICLGMQLMSERSEEGQLPGLGFFDAETVRFNLAAHPQLKIPHMGWNEISLRKDSGLFRDMYEEPRFYFVHSYHFVCRQAEDVLTTTHYGYDFVSAVQKGNILATQFHPEKSLRYGLKLIQNFIERI